MLAATSPQVLAEEFRSSDTPTPRAVSENRLPQAPAVVLTAPPTIASASTSPRDSEESYDLVSDQGARAVRAAPSTEDEEYSDWE